MFASRCPSFIRHKVGHICTSSVLFVCVCVCVTVCGSVCHAARASINVMFRKEMTDVIDGTGENVLTASGQAEMELVRPVDLTFGGYPCKDASTLLEEKIRQERLRSIELGTGETGIGYRSEAGLCKTLEVPIKVNENVRLLVLDVVNIS